MKKKLAAMTCAFACVLALGLTACGQSATTSNSSNAANANNTASNTAANTNTASIANPLVESTHQGVLDATGLDLPEIDGATYSYINMSGESPIAQATFTKGSTEYCYRMQSASGTTATDISGVYQTWTATDENAQVSSLPAKTYFAAEASLVTWFDVVPGINYSLSAIPGVEIFDLVNTAQSYYTPAQGDA